MTQPTFNRPYQGQALQGQALQQAKDLLGEDAPAAYLPDEGLVEAVNLAIFLQRPLLLKGEPGCGKTRLAEAVAWELYGESHGENYRRFYREWHIKSSSQARDGLYRYDHIGQLRDTQMNKAKDPENYVKPGPLGEAFAIEAERPVLLIDEIDKADLDFPNDLLRELERYEYTVEELDEQPVKKAQQIPIVIITSNDEKELPEAFLRRRVFYYIEFPDKDRLEDIIDSHFPGKVDQELLEAAIQRFLNLRKDIKRDAEHQKNVSTSELVDWFRVVVGHEGSISPERLKNESLLPPFWQVLLKGFKDPRRFLKPARNHENP